MEEENSGTYFEEWWIASNHITFLWDLIYQLKPHGSKFSNWRKSPIIHDWVV